LAFASFSIKKQHHDVQWRHIFEKTKEKTTTIIKNNKQTGILDSKIFYFSKNSKQKFNSLLRHFMLCAFCFLNFLNGVS
jgi:hypothetical protein